MNRRTVKPAKDDKEIRTGGIEEACARYGLGKASMRRVAEDAGAVIGDKLILLAHHVTVVGIRQRSDRRTVKRLHVGSGTRQRIKRL